MIAARRFDAIAAFPGFIKLQSIGCILNTNTIGERVDFAAA